MHVFCLCGLEVESKLLQELCENTDESIFSTTSKVNSSVNKTVFKKIINK